MDILSLLFSKLGAVGAGILAILALWFGMKYQKGKREQAEARAEVAETVLEVEHDQQKRAEKVDDMSDDDVLDYWGSKSGVRDKAGDSSPASPGKTTTGEPDQG